MKSQNHPKHKLALADSQNTKNGQAENDLQNKDVISSELSMKSLKARIEERYAEQVATKASLEVKYRKAAAKAINKVKQDLATKEIKQSQKQEIERRQRNETLSAARLEPEAGDNLKVRNNCNTSKMDTGKPFGITKIGARIMSTITVGGHEVTRNLSEPSDQTVVHIDVYADYLRTIRPQTPSRVGGKSIR